MVDFPPRFPTDYRKTAKEGELVPTQELFHTDTKLGIHFHAHLGLGKSILLEVDRQRLDCRLGSGIVLGTDIPTLPFASLETLSFDFTTGEVHYQGASLGSLLREGLTAVIQDVLRHELSWSPSEETSVIDAWLSTRLRKADEYRQVWKHIWIHPHENARLAIRSSHVKAIFQQGLHITFWGVTIAIASLRYQYGTGRVRLRQPDTQHWLRKFFNGLLLRLISWFASRWLHARLPEEMNSAIYDLFADEQRIEHLQAFFANLKIGQTSQPEQSAPSFVETLKAKLVQLPYTALGNENWWFAQFLSPFGFIQACAEKSEDISLQRTASMFRLTQERGIFIHIGQFPSLHRIRLYAVEIDRVSATLQIHTSAKLGAFLEALLQHLWQTQLYRKVQPSLRKAIGFESSAFASRQIWKQSLGALGELTLASEPKGEWRIQHGPEKTRIQMTDGLEAAFQSKENIFTINLHSLQWEWRGAGKLTIGSIPTVGAFEQAIISQVIRHSLWKLHQKQPWINLFSYNFEPTKPVVETNSHVTTWRISVPKWGDVTMHVARNDQIRLTFAREHIVLSSQAGVSLVSDELGFSVVCERFAFDLRQKVFHSLTTPPLGDVANYFLGHVIQTFVLPWLTPFLPPPPPYQPWLLFQRSFAPWMDLQICVPERDSVTLLRGYSHLTLEAADGVELTLGEPIPPVFIQRLHWQLPQNEMSLQTSPPAGALVSLLLQVGIVAILPTKVIDLVLPKLALPHPPEMQPRLLPEQKIILWRSSLPGMGDVQLSFQEEAYQISLSVTQRGFTLTTPSNLSLLLVEQAQHIQFHQLQLSWMPSWAVELETLPSADQLEAELILGLFRKAIRQFEHLWHIQWVQESSQTYIKIEVAAQEAWGPLILRIAEHGSISVQLDATTWSLTAQTGIKIQLASWPWLPHFYLHRVSYTLATGEIELAISGISERFYHEQEPISSTSKKIITNLIKTQLFEKIPSWLSALGIRKLPLPSVGSIESSHIKLFNDQLPGNIGMLMISMDPDDILSVRASETEVSLDCILGLRLLVPQLFVDLKVRHVRYHPQSGEVQFEGLGQLENAVLEAALIERFGIETAEEDEKQMPMEALLSDVPINEEGHRLLFKAKFVRLYMLPDTQFTLKFSSDHIEFVVDPPLRIDGPSVVDYQLSGLCYDFKTANFKITMDQSNVLAQLFSKMIVERMESELSKLFIPLLPQVMRQPGYTLAKDPQSAKTLMQVVRRFSDLR